MKLMKIRENIDTFLEKHLNDDQIELFWYYMTQLKENLQAVLPISGLLVLAMAIFFQQSVSDPWVQVGGLTCAIFGLLMFTEGLRVSVMPLAEALGNQLPKKRSLPVVLCVCFLLGILVTLAEPATAALVPLGKLVDRTRAPYLFFLLSYQNTAMIFAIAMGVGIAAVVGTLKFTYQWSIKKFIVFSLALNFATTLYMQFGDPDLQPLVGVSWDCGAITTGPVTVPVLLALGIGVMQSKKEKRKAKEILRNPDVVSGTGGVTLEGFGIVTLASLFPILMVQILSIALSFLYTRDDILNLEVVSESTSVFNTSPLREIIYAIRAMLPLVAALIIGIVFLAKSKIPPISFYLLAPQKDIQLPVMPPESPQVNDEDEGKESVSDNTSAQGAGQTVTDVKGEPVMQIVPEDSTLILEPDVDPSKPRDSLCSVIYKNRNLILGVFVALVGLSLFNVGLAYGFTSVSNQAGTLLPAAYLEVDGIPKSPYYNYGGGLFIVLLVIFLLGLLATKAEPALAVLGKTVEKLSGGHFSGKLLVWSVAVGVGCGMVLGAIKILFQVAIVYMIAAKYAVCLILTAYSDEAFTSIAWDSAGVTTGPVTVPFVLSLGIGLSNSVNGSEGFGILTAASAAPVISVLVTRLLLAPIIDKIKKKRKERKAARKAEKERKKAAEAAGDTHDLTSAQIEVVDLREKKE
jgi:hypothetical protein